MAKAGFPERKPKSTAAPTAAAGVKPVAATEASLPLDVIDRKHPAHDTSVWSSSIWSSPIWSSAVWPRIKSLRLVPLLILVMMTGGIVGIYFQPPGLRLALSVLGIKPGGGTTNPIAVPAPPKDAGKAPATATVIAGIGKLVPRGDVITIAPPFGAGDARIAALKAREGDRVAQGDVLAVLDNEHSLRTAIDVARSSVALKEANLQQTRETVIASRDEAQASLARAEAAIVSTKRDLDRVTELRQRGFAADASYDLKRVAYDQAVQDAARARATLTRYAFDTADNQADVVVARRNVEAARAELERATIELDKAYVRAPIAGTVLTVHLRPGEKPGAKGIMNLGDLDDMTAEIEIYQTQIGAIVLDAPVTITADALPRPLAGTVMRIGLEVAKQSLTDANPAANTDARVVKVYVRLAPDANEIARRFTNLQVIARIAVEPVATGTTR